MESDKDNLEILDEVTLCIKASGMEAERVRELAGFAREHDLSLIEILINRAGVKENILLKNLASLMKLDFLEKEKQNIPDEVLGKISPAIAIRQHVMPLEESDGMLKLAYCDPFDWEHWDDIIHILDRPLEKVLCPRNVIDQMLKAHYGIGADTVERLVGNHSDQDIQTASRMTTDLSEEEAANEPTVVNLLNKILSEAIRANATDIHFEPFEGKYRIRYRIDGMLEDISMPVSVNQLKLALVSRIKIMSKLDITEKRLPQDGRSQVSLAGQQYDLRVSILPGIFGEGVVIRLQSRQMVKLDLGALGFESEDQEKISHLINRPHGLMLITGPTGSGKTTTLYTCLSAINHPESKIITIEDPVEYWMEDMLQMQVHETIGFTFARALRSMLRHDPDIMLIGEIRDRETADIAIRSSLTGHLVFATLHTNDAASAATRMIDIGIEPFLVSSSVHGILAQRLVRKVCSYCQEKIDISNLNDFERTMLQDGGGFKPEGLRQGQGCEKCRFTGYRGRMAIGEVLIVSQHIRSLIQQREPTENIKEIAYKEGMRTLRENAMILVNAGKTTPAEAFRVTQEDFDVKI
jgi:general secretion pathway protein E/type IV pilus assembly protein PilB